MRPLYIFFTIFSLVLVTEATEINMDCTFPGGDKSPGDWEELGWDLIEDGLGLIPDYGGLTAFEDTIHDFFGDDLEGIYFSRWEKCIKSWIQNAIDESLKRDAAANLFSMATTLRRLRETLEGMTSVDSADDWLLYGPDTLELKVLADVIEAKVAAANGHANMIAPFKHAFYIELTSMLLVGRRLLDMNASSTALYHWKMSGISRMKTYRDYVDHFKTGYLKPYIEDWNVTLNNYNWCSAWSVPDFLGVEACAIECQGTAYCQVTTTIKDIEDSKDAECICDIWPYTHVCQGDCFFTQCKGDFDTVKGDCEGKKDDMVAKETATKKTVNDFLDKVLNLSTEAEILFGSIETGGQQYEW